MFWNKKKNDLIILCNSWPKSGTHLLLNMSTTILGNKKQWYKENAIKSPPNRIDELYKTIDERINLYKTNFAMKGHIGYSKELVEYLKKRNIKVLFIVRDPRDVICSTVRWVTDLRENWKAHEVFEKLNKEERISLAIHGMPESSPFSDNDSFVLWQKPIKERYKLLTPWADSKDACLLKYEELSGNFGEKAYEASINEILNFLDIEDNKLFNKLSSNLIDKNSQTFHSGESGGWKTEFSQKNLKEFIDVGGEELVLKFGYTPSIKEI